jgi:hypothetical protein
MDSQNANKFNSKQNIPCQRVNHFLSVQECALHSTSIQSPLPKKYNVICVKGKVVPAYDKKTGSENRSLIPPILNLGTIWR